MFPETVQSTYPECKCIPLFCCLPKHIQSPGDLSNPFFIGKSSSASVKHNNEYQFIHVLYLARRYVFVSRTQDRLARADSDRCEMILPARRL